MMKSEIKYDRGIRAGENILIKMGRDTSLSLSIAHYRFVFYHSTERRNVVEAIDKENATTLPQPTFVVFRKEAR